MMDTFAELQQLADDLTEPGETATAALVRQAIDRVAAWKFEAGEELLERALEERRKHEDEPPWRRVACRRRSRRRAGVNRPRVASRWPRLRPSRC